MSATPKEELPKIADSLKNELVSGCPLKHTSTEEKIVLPTPEDIKNEKNVQAVLKGVEDFKHDELKHIKPEIKNVLPTQEEIEAEKKNAQS